MPTQTRWVLILVVVASIVPYVSTVGMGFVYDDRPQIAENPNLRLWPGFIRVFTSDVWSMTNIDSTSSSYYRPLMWVGYNAVFSIAGPSPWAFHLLNLMLHVYVTVMLFVLSLTLWKDVRVAGIAAVLFALHPIHSEPVAWIAALPELGFTLFFLLALYFHVLEYRLPSHTVIACLTCYGVALLWKESALTFLPCVVLYDFLVARRLRPGRYACIAGVTLAYFVLRVGVLGGIAPTATPPAASLVFQAITAASNNKIVRRFGIEGERLART